MGRAKRAARNACQARQDDAGKDGANSLASAIASRMLTRGWRAACEHVGAWAGLTPPDTARGSITSSGKKYFA